MSRLIPFIECFFCHISYAEEAVKNELDQKKKDGLVEISDMDLATVSGSPMGAKIEFNKYYELKADAIEKSKTENLEFDYTQCFTDEKIVQH